MSMRLCRTLSHLHTVPGGSFRYADIESVVHAATHLMRRVTKRTGPVPRTLFPELDGQERGREFVEPLQLCTLSERLQEYATDARVHPALQRHAAVCAYTYLWFGLTAARTLYHRYDVRGVSMCSTGTLGVVRMSAHPECAVTWEVNRFTEYAVPVHCDVFDTALTVVQ